MRWGLMAAAGVLFGMTVVSDARAAAVSRDDFLVETTGNLVALCGASSSDPLYTAAENFCHGFAVGTYRMISMEQAASRSKRRLYCLPAKQPTRDEAIASFVQWAQARPQTLANPPSDGILEYLTAQYPCSQSR